MKKPCFLFFSESVIFCFLVMIFSSRIAEAQFSKGADVGWLSQMEATGYKFYDSTGVEINCLQILKDHGINTIRLRVFVNPSSDRINGHCSKDEVVAMALRAKNMGMRTMIDFHFSDSWADPGKQTKPAAWASHSFSQLFTDVYDHTTDVLTALKSSGVIPEWVQIGNEIIGGMLWPDGSTLNWGQLAQLLNKGYDATKAVDSAIKVVIHIDQGNNNSRCRYFYDNAQNNGVRYDVIGLSYYPYWLGSDYTVTINNLGSNLIDMASRYGKEVMVVEVGGDYTKVKNTYDMLVAVINKVRAVPDNKGLGVIYWEPEGEKSWSGYQLSCWGSDGKPTAALNAFLSWPTGINTIKDKSGFKIYPNPASGGLLNIELSDLTVTSIITIFDVNGKLMREQKMKDQPRAFIDVNFLPGIYMINIDSGQQTATRKLLIN
ncbi:MAG: glycosyl hydrolase 53 family protein [Bacteroidales bacterium]|nr:glycosyl hydrolase 53 family protein [Bacteroidales bacterium]